MIERLVGFDTTSAKSNLPLIAFVEGYLAAHGVASRRSGGTDGKSNLLATLGPERPGGIVLSGHSDVVPVAGQDWASDPFRLIQRDSRLYGRGSADMKSFIAIALALVPEFLAAELPEQAAAPFDHEPAARLPLEPAVLQQALKTESEIGFRIAVGGVDPAE